VHFQSKFGVNIEHVVHYVSYQSYDSKVYKNRNPFQQINNKIHVNLGVTVWHSSIALSAGTPASCHQ